MGRNEGDGAGISEDLGKWENVPLVHVCEVCGKTEVLTPSEAFNAGWDYPPRMGMFGVVSPRTCGNCNMMQTIWWALTVEHKKSGELTGEQLKTFERILGEPGAFCRLRGVSRQRGIRRLLSCDGLQ